MNSTPARRPAARWHHLPEMAVAVAVASGLSLVAVNFWRTGLAVFGGGLVLAAVARLLLPPHEVPLLVNRARLTDVVVLLGLGSVVLLLAYNLIYDSPVTIRSR